MYVRDDLAPLGLAALGLGDTAGAAASSAGSAPVGSGGAQRIEQQPRAIITGPFDGLALNGPTDVAIAPDGARVITDAGNHRIVVVERDGTLRRAFGSKCDIGQGAASGCADPDGDGPLELGDLQFNEPWGVAVARLRRHLRERHLEPPRRALRCERPLRGQVGTVRQPAGGRRSDRRGADLLRPARHQRLLRRRGGGGRHRQQAAAGVLARRRVPARDRRRRRRARSVERAGGHRARSERHAAGGRHLEPSRQAPRSSLCRDRELARTRLAQRRRDRQALPHRRRPRLRVRRRSHRRPGLDLRAERATRGDARSAAARERNAAAARPGGRHRRPRAAGGRSDPAVAFSSIRCPSWEPFRPVASPGGPGGAG